MKVKYNQQKTITNITAGVDMTNLILGLFFLIPGTVMILVTLKVIPMQGGDIPLYAGLPFGGVFFTIGLVSSMGRRGIYINTEQQSAIVWWGILVAFRKKQYEMSAIEKVIINKEIRRSKNSSYSVFPVRLQHSGEKVKIAESRDYLKSRRLGEATARALHKSLSDYGQGGVVTRDWDKLDESVRDRIRRTGESIPDVRLPKDSAVKINELHSSLTIDIPAAGFGLASGIALIIVLIPLLFFIPMIKVVIMSAGHSMSFVPIIFVAVPMIFIGVFVLKGVGGIFTKAENLKISINEIVITRGKEEKKILVKEIEEVFSRSGFLSSAVILITDKKIYRIGESLKKEEIRFVKNKILKMISS